MVMRIALATPEDQARLTGFLRDHWSSSHIFVERPDVFTWQHLDPSGRFNMVFAEDTDRPEDPVLGVLGFIPMGRFDEALGHRDVMLAIWKVRDDLAPPGLGVRLLRRLKAELEPRLIGAVGTSEMVRRIYQILGYEVGSMEQAALFRPGTSGHRIASGVPAPATGAQQPTPVRIELVEVAEDAPTEIRDRVDELAVAVVPAKSFDYVVERYLRHPWYQYVVRGIRQDGELVAVVVWRVVSAEGSCVLRIVDVVGQVDWIAHAGAVLQGEIVASDAEYLDIVHWGIDPQVLAAAGFVRAEDAPGLVLPTYFAPFEARNIEIEMAYRLFNGDGPVRFFRADSDQDRPNRVWEVDPPA